MILCAACITTGCESINNTYIQTAAPPDAGSEPPDPGSGAPAPDVEPSALDGMIQFWVHKGKLREVCDMGCSSCGVSNSCPACVLAPRRYELVTDDGAGTQARPAQEPPRHSCCH